MIKLIQKTTVRKAPTTSLFKACELEETEEWIEVEHDESYSIFTFEFGDEVDVNDGEDCLKGTIEDVDVYKQEILIEDTKECVMYPCEIVWYKNPNKRSKNHFEPSFKRIIKD